MRDEWPHRASLAGGAVWLAIALLAGLGVWRLGLVDLLLLLAVLVVVPLGMALIDPPGKRRHDGQWLAPGRRLYPLAGLLVAGSFGLPAGMLAALLASPWLLLAVLAALATVARRLDDDLAPLDQLSRDAALLFLPVGAIWLLFSRAGIRPGGFQEPIVLLTAVHFHYAGFGAPLLAGLAGGALPPGRPGARRAFRLAASGLISAIPLVAVSFGRWRMVESAAVVILAASLLLLSGLVLRVVAPAVRPPAARALLVVSGIAPVVPMILAVVYSWGLLTGEPRLTIAQMARWHGMANAVGFILAGLLAWSLRQPEPPAAPGPGEL